MPDTQTYSDDEVVGTFGAARVLGVSHDTVRRLADNDDLPFHMTGPPPAGRRRFRVGDLRSAQAKWTADARAAAALPSQAAATDAS